jgi:hypothetical protein
VFRELLKLIGENGGKLPYGSMGKLIKEYKGNGFKAVTRQNLYYGLKNMKNNMAIDNLAVNDLYFWRAYCNSFGSIGRDFPR